MATKPLAMIRMQTFEPCIITTEEYEAIQRDVRGRILAGDAGVGDRILLTLLEEHASRYSEAKARNAECDGILATISPCADCRQIAKEITEEERNG